MPNTPDILDLIRPMAAMIEPLSHDDRITLLMSMIAQEICTLPASERQEELRDVIYDFPNVLAATEDGMQQMLVKNAKGG